MPSSAPRHLLARGLEKRCFQITDQHAIGAREEGNSFASRFRAGRPASPVIPFGDGVWTRPGDPAGFSTGSRRVGWVFLFRRGASGSRHWLHQDCEAFLREVTVTGKGLTKATLTHGVHGDAVGQTVAF